MLSTPLDWIRRDDMTKEWVIAMNTHTSFTEYKRRGNGCLLAIRLRLADVIAVALLGETKV
ncbi:MAG: hypothetical protein NXI00_20685 [Cytophagales bacterium]|nr:hypothetical protein [Cytophagales bacterium]